MVGKPYKIKESYQHMYIYGFHIKKCLGKIFGDDKLHVKHLNEIIYFEYLVGQVVLQVR